MNLDDLDFNVSDEWKEFDSENPALLFVPEFAEDGDGHVFLRNKKGSAVYRVLDDENLFYECVQCNEGIQISVIMHPLFRKGQGIEHYEEHIPFCPRCEGAPKTEGALIPMGVYDPRRTTDSK